MAKRIFHYYKYVYATHKMTYENIVRGAQCGAIDTATGYNNADLIRRAINDDPRIKTRPTLITKFNPGDFARGIERVAKEYMNELRVKPDIVLIHSTLPTHQDNIMAYKKLQEIFRDKIIGVSNFDYTQLKYMTDNNCKPDVIQIEYHPFFQPKKILQYCRENDIHVMAYRPFAKDAALQDPVIKQLAANKSTTPANLILDWLASKNILPVASSANPDNIMANINRTPQILTDNEISQIDALDQGLNGSTCMTKFCKMDGFDIII